MNTPVQDCELPNRGPRVTPADIEASIASEHYFTAAEGLRGASVDGTLGAAMLTEYATEPGGALSLLTICVLILRNGFTVLGQSACASPQNFDAEIGKRIARQHAVAQLWPLLGYALREKIANGNGHT